ncbi:lytic transglycosylase domain-containing protein [Streptomyces novaecaesareae]|uniref:lytic transglycosylase domain-containing protein n=1 Tax=Streptomyces novaecaesareae TaxID=68244 RepID=UPI0004AA148D|nr:lytic murein transglycosylase [Streptomyces novaecaesareae]
MTARFGSTQGGRKLRVGKRVTGTAAAFAALAALTGSQVTGLGLAPVAAADTGPTNSAASQSADFPLGSPSPGTPGTFGTGVPADGGGTVQLPQPPGALPGAPAAGPFAATGPALPATVFAAYRQAEASLAQRSPGCHLPWQLLAGIGQVESGQANGGQVDASGTLLRPILGPALDGNGFAAIPDTDGGRYDGDARWDRAVGPMQFIPSTWAAWGVDANGDGKADPNNVFDAAEAAGRYLCAGGRDLADPAQLDRAVLSYNNSGEYLRTVRNWMAHYGSGTVTTVPNRPGAPVPPTSLPSPYLPAGGSTTGSGSTGTGTGTTPVPTPDPTAQPTTAPSPTTAPTPSGSPSPTAQPTTTPTGTPSGTPSTTPSTTPTGTPTGTPTACPDPTATATPTGTPSGSPTGTPTPTGSPSPTATPTGTPTATPTGTPTGTPSCPTPAPTATGTPSPAPSTTPSASLSPSAAPKR